MLELAREKARHEETKKCVFQNRVMAKTFWERWRYELEERKELQCQNSKLWLSLEFQRPISCKKPCEVFLPRVDRSLLNPQGCVCW